MQHNARPPHLRGSHPMAPMHPNAGGRPPHMPPMNMGPPSQQQQPSAQMSHAATTPLQPAPHLREHPNNRLNHKHPNPFHASTQMQKIRQQNQNLNNHNNNKSNHHQQQQQAQYNHVNALPPTLQHMAAAQQQQQHQRSNSHHQQQQQQQPHHLPPPLQQQQQHGANNNMHKQQQQLPTPAQQHGQHNYYVAGANSKHKYNNGTVAAAATVNYVAPKTILQNPARMQKSRLSMPASTPATATISTASNRLSNNAHAAVTTSDVTVAASSSDMSATVSAGTFNGSDNTPQVGEAVSAGEASTETPQMSTTTTVDNENDELSNNDNDNLLPIEDTMTTKHSKEKTPMCLVNELARFNKITHQYRLTSEKGPAHCKRFTVTLKLGDEEYSAEGFKIKKAQHLAAAEAIEKTKYKHPVPKTNRRLEEGSGLRANITPTVELNALAMKLGQQTYYLFDPLQMPTADGMLPLDGVLPPYGPPTAALVGHMPHHARMLDPSAYMRRNGAFAPPTPLPYPAHPHQRGPRGCPPRFHQRYPMMPPYGAPAIVPCKITLIVGKQKFVGIGRTLQQAKHDAAARALQVLKTQATNQLNELLHNSLEESDSKSPISLVHEIGIKRNLTVHFKVLREEGLAHMKNFITACIVGSIVTEGEGNGKKISKKRAAEKMLEELKKLPPLTPTKSPVKRIKVKTTGRGAAGTATSSANTPNARAAGNDRRKRAGASIKEKLEGEDIDAENPITKLIQLQQNRKEKEPVFELIAKNGNENSRRREFIIEVAAQGMVARGTGNSKKLAKRNAAQNLLIAMGLESSGSCSTDVTVAQHKSQPFETAGPTGTTTSSPAADIHTSSSSNVTASRAELVTATLPTAISSTLSICEAIDVPLISTSAGQVPGILILRQNKKHAAKKKEIAANNVATGIIEETKDSKQEESNTVVATNTVNDATAPTVTATDAGAVTDKTAAAIKDNSSNVASSSTAGGNNSSSSNSNSSNSTSVHMKDQLLYLAKLLGFEVNFSDYPKGNHNEYLTIVTLSTNPPQICHGVGTSSEESQNDAARSALKILSELGLNNAKK